MQKNLVIVESPAKAKTIEKFLGEDFKVMSSFGHIRDLDKKNDGVDPDTFQPHYEIPADKQKVVSELRAAAKKVETVWLASDEDREGLAHPGRDAEVGRRLSPGESFGQAHLVVPGLMPSDLAEEVCEVQAAHINTPENLFLPWISSTPSPLGQHRQHFRADH